MMLARAAGAALARARPQALPSLSRLAWRGLSVPADPEAPYGHLLDQVRPSRRAGAAAESDASAGMLAWAEAMEAGDWEQAWDIFEARTSEAEAEAGLPSLEEVMASSSDAEDSEEEEERALVAGVAEGRGSGDADEDADVDADEDASEEAPSAARAHRPLRAREVDAEGRSRGLGKRKTSVAVVWLRPAAAGEQNGLMVVNGRPLDQQWRSMQRRVDVLSPFIVADRLGTYDVMAGVRGGGESGQAQAVRHGIARALERAEPELREPLKSAGHLARDSRIVERKKPGKKKARKEFQWVKR